MKLLYALNCLFFLLLCHTSFAQNPASLADLSLKELNDSIKAKPNNADLYFYRGLQYNNDINSGLALADFSTSIRLNPAHFNAYIKRAGIYYRQDKSKEALLDFSKAIKINPGLVSVYYNRAICYVSLRRYDSAITDLTTYISKNPGRYEAYHKRAVAYQQIRKDSMAIIDFTHAIRLNDTVHTLYIDRGKSYHTIWENRSFNYQQSGNSASYQWKAESGAEDFFKALRFNPKSMKAYMGIMYICLTLRELYVWHHQWLVYKEAGGSKSSLEKEKEIVSVVRTRIFDILNEAIRINPGVANGYAVKAAVYNVSGNTIEAIRDCNTSISLDNDYAYAYSTRAEAYKIDQDYPPAIADYSKAIALSPQNAGYYNNRGLIYKKTGSKELALKDFQQALKLDPKEKIYQKNLAEINDYNPVKSFKIDAARIYNSISVMPGDVITIKAVGNIRLGAFAGIAGPDGMGGYANYSIVKDLTHGALLARVNNDPWEKAGSFHIIYARESGILQLTVNDADASNNSGHFNVDIKVERK